MFDELTENDIQKMKEEIEYRKTVLRPQLLIPVKEARAQGDLSENFEYKAAKREKNRNESRIRYLEKMIKTAHIITDSSAEDEVGINTRVTVYFIEDEEEDSFKIVTTIRGDSLNGYISTESPLGKALLGHKVGDVCFVEVKPGAGYEVEIRHIDKSEDDSMDAIRSF